MIRLAYDNARQRADLVRSGGNLEMDEGLDSAVVISLFSDRADPSGTMPRRGFWADTFNEDGDELGSRLWLLPRARVGATAKLRLAEEYAVEALQWLIDDGVASAVRATAEWLASAGEILLLTVSIERPAHPAPRWQRVWEVHLNAL